MKLSLLFNILLIVFCGTIEIIVLFILKTQPDSEDKIALAALTISISAILSIFLILLTNREANKYGKLYFNFLCLKPENIWALV